ncbi:MAG: dephospho-CoA kinase [Candidatus Omnitrophica bacterium]|nr:dephospho-CoA kinase [Candidatus Omnitrophota bacterium]
MKKQLARNKKLIIGLTGSFGSGKSMAARFFMSHGAEIIDADKIARSLLTPGSPCYKKIVAIFGGSIVGSRRRIDRKKLAGLVFTDSRSLNRLNSIIHPEVVRSVKKTAKKSCRKVIVIDAPLLIEAGLVPWVDKVIVVTISRKEQLKRIIGRSGLKKEDIENRIKAQMPLSRKVRLADFIIDNNGTVARTKEQVERIWKTIISTPRR